jgi:hypothetical protein
MVDIGGGDNVVDLRSTSFVHELMRVLTHVLDATGRHGPPAPLASAAHQEHFARTNKLHRAALACCTTLVWSMPRMFAPHVPVFLHATIETMVSLDPMAMRSLPIKRLVGTTGFVRAVLRCKAYNGSRPSGPGRGGGGGGERNPGGADGEGSPRRGQRPVRGRRRSGDDRGAGRHCRAVARGRNRSPMQGP